MKIACCMTTVGYSGAPKMMAWVSNQLFEAGHDVDLVTFFRNDDIQLVNSGINRIDFAVERKSSNILGKVVENVKPAFLLRSYVQRTKPEAVLLFSNLSSFVYLLLFRPKGVKVYISERGDPKTGGRLGVLLRKSYKKTNGIICQTQGALDALPSELHSKCVVIPNPATQKKEEKVLLENRRNFIAFPARFDNIQKRHDIMVEAFAKIHAKYPTLRLAFFGDGSDMEMIKALVEKKKLSRFVDFHGRVTPIQNYIRDARMMILTSDFEGIPNSIIDAMALGVPVIATDCTPGGARMLIKNKENGILVNRGDITAVAESISYIMDNPKHADQMATNAQDILVEYAPEKISSLWCEFFNNIL